MSLLRSYRYGRQGCARLSVDPPDLAPVRNDGRTAVCFDGCAGAGGSAGGRTLSRGAMQYVLRARRR